MIAKLVEQKMYDGAVTLTLQLGENGPGSLFPKDSIVSIVSSIREYVEGSYEINLGIMARPKPTQPPAKPVVLPTADKEKSEAASNATD